MEDDVAGSIKVFLSYRSGARIRRGISRPFLIKSDKLDPSDGTVEFAVSACSIYIFRSYESFVDETRGVFGADSDVSSAMD